MNEKVERIYKQKRGEVKAETQRRLATIQKQKEDHWLAASQKASPALGGRHATDDKASKAVRAG